MTSVLPAQCFACAHLDPLQDQNTGTAVAVTCRAYPDRIPREIATGGDHRTARGGEAGGLVFEQADTDEAHDAFDWWQKTFG